MKISGFSFVRNAQVFDYPVEESLQSLAPLCDEVVVAVGKSDDETLAVVQDLALPNPNIVETVWDDSLREGGRILAEQTNVALAHCTGDWCIYLQADEVLHERDYETIRREIARADGDSRIEALILRYKHFYASYDYVGGGRQWYRREIRILRNTGKVTSWGDAQGFRKNTPTGNELLSVRQIEAFVYHYGWVKPPDIQQRKQKYFNKLWHDDAWMAEHISTANTFDYSSSYAVSRFTGEHPAIMRERVERAESWTRNFRPERLKEKPLLVKILDGIEEKTGWRIGEYRNFREV